MPSNTIKIKPDGSSETVSVAFKNDVFIILSGGPGVYEPSDTEHDKSWDNYVSPPLLRSLKKPLHGSGEEVHWLVYEPAYQERWQSDSQGKQKRPVQYAHAMSIKKEGFSDYLAKLKDRAVKRGWKYKGIQKGQDFLDYINGLSQKVSRVWFYGHASYDLWLSLTHDGSVASSPARNAILTSKDISKLKSARFVSHEDPGFWDTLWGLSEAQKKEAKKPKHPHKFFGCNTTPFAKEWADSLGVHARGSEGKVSFAKIHDTAGYVVLAQGATWHEFDTDGDESQLPDSSGTPLE
jgi:hypothetical protein